MSPLPEHFSARFEEEETLVLLEMTVEFLRNIHSYSKEQAIELLEAFFAHYDNNVWDLEDYIHNELPYRLAAIVHFREGLKGEGNALDFLRESGFEKTPPEVQEEINQRLDALWHP